MLRGSIEQAGPHVVSGWAYSADADISGRVILVFEGATCLGAGRIALDRDAEDVEVVAEYALDPRRLVWVHPAAEVTLRLPGGAMAAVFDAPPPPVVWGRAT